MSGFCGTTTHAVRSLSTWHVSNRIFVLWAVIASRMPCGDSMKVVLHSGVAKTLSLSRIPAIIATCCVNILPHIPGGIRAAIAQARTQGYLSSVVLMVGLNDVACVRECHANKGYITAICDGISYIVRSLCEVMCTPMSASMSRRQPSVHVITVPVMPGWPEWKALVARMVNAYLLRKSAFDNTLACNVHVINFDDLKLESPVHKQFLSDHVGVQCHAHVIYSC